MRREILERLLDARANKRACVLCTELVSGGQTLAEGHLLDELGEELAEAARRALASDAAAVVTLADQRRIFVEPRNPPLRLIIVGAVHIAQPLAEMAALADFTVTIVDPRTAFATAERFAGVDLRVGWPDEELSALCIDERTAIVALTHDPKLDDPALAVALSSAAFYVGALGSAKTQSSRRERLAAAGIDSLALARIRGPVGLDIGAATAAEIAVSILAEIILELRR